MTDDPHDEVTRMLLRAESRKKVAARMAQHFGELDNRQRRDYTRAAVWGLIFMYAAAVFGFVAWLVVEKVM